MRSGGKGVFARLTAAALLAGMLATSGCATYSDRLENSRTAVTAGDYEAGIAQLQKVIKVDDPEELPSETGSDVSLALLERATLQQARSEYPLSARDFGAADKQLDLLDLSGDAVGTLGKYVYSDSATKYVASPVEKLSLNGFNMMNYLAEGDLPGARVEAKRFTTMRSYLESIDPEQPHAAFASYLAGFTHEKLGEWSSAIRYYDEALAHHRFETLRAPVARLSRLASYRGKALGPFLAEKPVASPGAPQGSDLLVVVSIGRVPNKYPERIPVGAAVGIAGAFIVGDPAVLAYSATKVVVYPELAPNASVLRSAALKVNGRPARLELASDLGGEITREYQDMKPKIIGAAISRMIARALAAEATRQSINAATDSGWGHLAALAVEGLMVAMDKPDTRSWNFMPNQVFVYRQRVEPGVHEVSVVLGNDAANPFVREVEIPPGGFGAVILTAPR